MRGWSPGPHSVLALGARKEIPPLEKTYRSALHWALQVMRSPLVSGRRLNGAAAFQAWADHLLLDDAFPAGEMEILRQRFLTHDSVVGLLAEGRWYGAKFLEMVAETEPAVEDALLNAAACFVEEHDLMWQVWGLVGGNGQPDENVHRLADPGVRRNIVPLILRAREKDAEAADLIEEALSFSEKTTFPVSSIKESKMEPKFIEKDPIRLVGVTAFGKPETITPNLNDIWVNQFMKYDDLLKPFSTDKAYYGAWIGDPEGNATYIAGMAVANLPEIPEGLEERILPAATYAVFDCTVDTFGRTYGAIYGTWLPQSGYEYDMMASDFEFYPSDTATSDSPTQIFLPVKVKQPQAS
jgi:predicted transcriptional regulator YdeE